MVEVDVLFTNQSSDSDGNGQVAFLHSGTQLLSIWLLAISWVFWLNSSCRWTSRENRSTGYNTRPGSDPHSSQQQHPTDRKADWDTANVTCLPLTCCLTLVLTSNAAMHVFGRLCKYMGKYFSRLAKKGVEIMAQEHAHFLS